MVDHQYIEVSCQRAIEGNSFGGGLQDFIFSIGRPSVAFMDKSYMRFELEVKGPGAGVPKVADQIALAEGCVANMYNNAYFKAGGSDTQLRASSPKSLPSNGGRATVAPGSRESGCLPMATTVTDRAASPPSGSQVGIPLAEGKSEIYRWQNPCRMLPMAGFVTGVNAQSAAEMSPLAKLWSSPTRAGRPGARSATAADATLRANDPSCRAERSVEFPLRKREVIVI